MTTNADILDNIRRISGSISAIAEHLKQIGPTGLGERLTAYTQGLMKSVDQLEKRISTR